MKRRLALVAALAALALGGCAALRMLDSEVTAYSLWPAERKPASYAFERLPSQQAQPEQQGRLEEAARPALEAAGFAPAPDPKLADVTVQLGARVTAADRSPFDDPSWWGPGYRRPWGPGFGTSFYFGPRYGWGPPFEHYRYEREVGVLIRDRRSGSPLYEARAVNEGPTPIAPAALPAMFSAALKDFPHGSDKPHRVTVEVRP